MKLGINLYLWTDHMHDGLLPVLQTLKQIGYDGWLTVEAFGDFLPNLAAATKIWRKLFDNEGQLASDAYAFLSSRRWT